MRSTSRHSPLVARANSPDDPQSAGLGMVRPHEGRNAAAEAPATALPNLPSNRRVATGNLL